MTRAEQLIEAFDSQSSPSDADVRDAAIQLEKEIKNGVWTLRDAVKAVENLLVIEADVVADETTLIPTCEARWGAAFQDQLDMHSEIKSIQFKICEPEYRISHLGERLVKSKRAIYELDQTEREALHVWLIELLALAHA